MNKKKSSRQDQIVAIVDQYRNISIEDLQREINMSKVTIRRDLADLEQQGRLIRRFGGATSVKDYLIPQGMEAGFTSEKDYKEIIKTKEYYSQINSFYPSSSYNDSLDQDPLVEFEYDTKLQIAREAVERIKNNSRIIIDAGSTTGKMLHYIGSKEKLQIMTNSLHTAYKLSQIPTCRRPRILVTGGSYDQASDTFQGQIVKEVLNWYNFEQLFIGADGIDFDHGTMTIHEMNSYSPTMAKISKEVVVLVESNKFGRKMPCLELPWECIDVLITDYKISSEDLDKLCQKDIEVIVARNKL